MMYRRKEGSFTVSHISGADQGVGVRGGEIRRGIWGPPRPQSGPGWSPGGEQGATPPLEAPAIKRF